MTGPHTWMRSDRRTKLKGSAVVIVVCLALLALLTVIQVAHVHAVATDADHCPLCIVLHTAAPVTVAAAIILLVQIEALAPVADIRPVWSKWQRQLFIRPPPSA